MELTWVARDLIPAFERTLQDFDAALDSARDIATQARGVVRLAALPSVAAESSLTPYCAFARRGRTSYSISGTSLQATFLVSFNRNRWTLA